MLIAVIVACVALAGTVFNTVVLWRGTRRQVAATQRSETRERLYNALDLVTSESGLKRALGTVMLEGLLDDQASSVDDRALVRNVLVAVLIAPPPTEEAGS